MSDIKLKVAEFVTDLLSVSPSSVLIGRENFEQESPETNLILVDTLVKGLPMGRSQDFDEDLETIKYSVSMKGNFTLDFYGADAETQAMKFMVLLSSQAGFELQLEHAVTLYHVSRITDLKKLEGSRQTNREQMEIVVHYVVSETVSTKRIDDEVIEYLNDTVGGS